jgi:hypothetical protein
MMTAISLACMFLGGWIFGHYWGTEIWPWLKARIATQWNKLP